MDSQWHRIWADPDGDDFTYFHSQQTEVTAASQQKSPDMSSYLFSRTGFSFCQHSKEYDQALVAFVKLHHMRDGCRLILWGRNRKTEADLRSVFCDLCFQTKMTAEGYNVKGEWFWKVFLISGYFTLVFK